MTEKKLEIVNLYYEIKKLLEDACENKNFHPMEIIDCVCVVLYMIAKSAPENMKEETSKYIFDRIKQNFENLEDIKNFEKK